MNKNICYAQNLSMNHDYGVIGFTHNYFAISPNSTIQSGKQYGLLPINCGDTFDGCSDNTTYKAYSAAMITIVV